MKVTIVGDLSQVINAASLLRKAGSSLRKQKRSLSTLTPRQKAFRKRREQQKVHEANRKVVRRAFEKVRYSADDCEDSAVLLAALTKVGGMTDEAIGLARQILGELKGVGL